MQTTDELQPLFTHTKRPGWGLAILAWEGREERFYQFQDGQLRTFKKGFYELLEASEPPRERALDIVRDLQSMLRITRGKREPGASAKGFERIVSFAEQQQRFERLYPAGFADPKWLEKVRGGEGAKPLKRHREPAIREAQERLSAAELDRAIAAGDHRAVLEAARRVLSSTDLVGSKDSGALRRLPQEQDAAFALALRELLHGAAPYGPRLGRYLAVLGQTRGERVTWPLATALSALVLPGDRALVKPSVVRQQAHWIAPSLSYDAAPSPAQYERLHGVIECVRGRLLRAGHEARDLLDVHDFMVETLRPAARAPLEVPQPVNAG